MSNKSVVKPVDLPKDPHWALLMYTYVTVPGYDKGDPNERKEVVEYRSFSSKEELESWLTMEAKFPRSISYSVIHVAPAVAETTVAVKVKE